MLIYLSWRNIWRNKVRSAVIMSSIALGMVAGVFIIALYYGMGNSRLKIAIEHEVSHIQIHHPDFKSDYRPGFSFPADETEETLRKTSGIKSKSLRSVASGMIANAGSANGVMIHGIDPRSENDTRALATFVKSGSYLDTSASGQILVSTRLAEKMNLRTGSKVVLTFTDLQDNIASGAFRVRGLYQSENAPLDEMHIFILKNELDTHLGISGQAHEAAILLQNDELLESTASALQTALPRCKVETWKQLSPETDLVISSLDSYSMIFIVIILMALSFGIVNAMLMAVLERAREIGMLMAIGTSKLRLFTMILLETIFLTVAGAPIGLFSGWLVILWFGKHGIDFSAMAGETMSRYGYAQIIYPELPFHSVIYTMILVMFTALFSAIVPAMRVLRLKPAEAIRR
ncbi:MAG: ABC transporter permease [Bacteroidota bacterium]|jgi:putative ABC transport system permease protein|nr:FtsX-like permease family protein [Saprospiraceae bacterium]